MCECARERDAETIGKRSHTFRTRLAKLSEHSVSSTSSLVGLTLAIISVFALPPIESCTASSRTDVCVVYDNADL